MQNIHKPCLACGDKGWFVVTKPDHTSRIERCESCNRYSSDIQATQAVDLMASAWLRDNNTRPFEVVRQKAYSP